MASKFGEQGADRNFPQINFSANLSHKDGQIITDEIAGSTPVDIKALRHLARIMKQHTRCSDIACRYGGEALVLVLPNTSLEVACERVEQLRQAVAEQTPQLETRYIPFTASLGVARFPSDGVLSGIDLIGKAAIEWFAANRMW